MKANPIVTLCVDACRGRVGTFAADKEKYADEAIRTAFNEILGDEGLTYQSWRRHNIEIYEIIEKTLNEVLPDAWNESPFYDSVVEVRNAMLGQKNEFIVDEPSVLVVSRFSGNHWDTDRTKLPGKKAFSLPTEWYDVRVYDELERFLKGTVTIEQMFSKIREALQKDIDGRVYSSFAGAGAYLPSAFNVTGPFDKDTMLELTQRVQTANGKTVRIAGTSRGLAKLDVDSIWISENMKNERHTTGRLRMWEGMSTLEIPQVFRRGSYDFKIDDSALMILPENFKPIKLYFEGDTRSRELGYTDTHDQTLDYELQTKLGVGVVFEGLFGKYTIV